MRKSFVAGNWKMNLVRRSAQALASAVREHVGQRTDVHVALFPPCVYLPELAQLLAGSPVLLGAQDVSDQALGAFTGEVSAAMLTDIGCKLALVGHSERRHVYGESDAMAQRKVAQALAGGLGVVLCVGETLAEREENRTEPVVRRQLTSALSGVAASDLVRISIAYEPVWAIGTGKTATTEQAQAVHAYLRGLVAGLYDEEKAETVRILYGGSVKADNAKQIMAMPDIDGTLVGGASLQAETFAAIIDSRK